MPQGFKDWVAENEEKQAEWASTPYFIKDNFVNGRLADGLKYNIVKGFEQKEGIITSNSSSGMLYFDPIGIKTFYDLTENIVKKVSRAVKKKALENYLKHNEHKEFNYKTKNGGKANIWTVNGSEYNETEFHIAEKLARSGQHVLFPKQSDLGKERKNDVYLYDAKTYIQQKVELKALFGEAADTITSQLLSGSGQASVIAYDIQSNIKKKWIIKGLRDGWTKNIKKVLLNYKGQWYEIDREKVFDDWLDKNLR